MTRRTHSSFKRSGKARMGATGFASEWLVVGLSGVIDITSSLLGNVEVKSLGSYNNGHYALAEREGHSEVDEETSQLERQIAKSIAKRLTLDISRRLSPQPSSELCIIVFLTKGKQRTPTTVVRSV